MLYFIIGLFVGFILSSILLSFLLKKKLKDNTLNTLKDIHDLFNGVK